VEAAGVALRRLVHHAVAARDEVGGRVDGGDPARTEPLREAFWAALADDLNAPRALSVASTVARSADLTAADRWSLLADFDRALAFGLADAVDPDAAGVDDADPAATALLAEREVARAERDFATADRLRDELAAAGYDVVDTPEGPKLRRR
jgi:cysteinyl-tRNA synthetase